MKDVGVDWIRTKVLNGEVGDFVTIARQEKGTENWFIGAITDENPRNISISLKFLKPDQIYDAIIYEDGKNAHWDKNPTDLNIRKIEVSRNMNLDLNLASGGGAAISIIKK
ncbi:MAG: glycoside hydrolase family 97 C-terminal domain-containing protein [Lutibacter sp.]